MSRRDGLLVFVAMPAGGPYEADQIRTMKAMFLLSQEGPATVRGMYHFQPYDYGPFDRAVYDDLDALEAERLIAAEAVPGTNRRIFRATESGEVAARDAADRMPADALHAIRSIKELVTSMSFLQLLRHVYGTYPEYAAKSIART